MIRPFYVINSKLVKSKVINKAIQDIGMGRYNWELFVLCGYVISPSIHISLFGQIRKYVLVSGEFYNII